MILPEEMIWCIEDHRQEAYGLLLGLARIPASSNHEERRAELYANWFRAQGARGVHTDQTLNVVYLANARQDGPVEVFMAHMDMVFPDKIELPLRVEGGRIYCPGAGDNTACLVHLLLADKYIARYVDSSRWREIREENTPGLLLACNAGEEGLGNLKGVCKVCENYGDRMECSCTSDSSLPNIVDRAVSSKRFRARVRIRGGHSYNNFGNDNAIACLTPLVGELHRIRVSKGGKITYNVGIISRGTLVNTIAQEAEMLYEFRSDQRRDLEYVERQPMKVIGRGKLEGMDVSLEIVGVRPCEGPADPKRKQVLPDQAHRVVEEMTGQAPKHCVGSTGCNTPLSLGVPSVCVGSFRGTGTHTGEEYMGTDSLEEGYKAVFGMILGSRD